MTEQQQQQQKKQDSAGITIDLENFHTFLVYLKRRESNLSGSGSYFQFAISFQFIGKYKHRSSCRLPFRATHLQLGGERVKYCCRAALPFCISLYERGAWALNW